MKNIKLIFSFLFVSTLLVFTSCDQEDDANAKKATLLSILKQNEDLSTLVSAIEETGLEETLSDLNGNYTFFAPHNDAFNTYLAANSFASIDAVPTATLREILLNHVIAQKIRMEDLTPSGYLKTLAHGNASSTNTMSMFVRNIDDLITLNGVSDVLIGDIQASNGLIHKVDAVIALPTIVDHAVANPQFSTLVTALTRDNLINNLATTLNGFEFAPYTVFAPVNSGFTNFFTDINSTLSDTSVAVLTDILSYHVVTSANVLGSSLVNDQVISTLVSQNVTVKIGGGNFRLEDANMRLSNFTLNDIQCSNGVIHAIDNVLLPNLD